MSTLETAFYNVERSLFFIDGPYQSYYTITKAIIALCEIVEEWPDDELIWSIGECGACCLSDLIIGAYWHYTEWHSGQYSQSYKALCALGNIFSPNMESGPEPESSECDVYNMLNELAEKESPHVG